MPIWPSGAAGRTAYGEHRECSQHLSHEKRHLLAIPRQSTSTPAPSCIVNEHYMLVASTGGVRTVTASVAFSDGFAWPLGGIVLRIRSPWFSAASGAGIQSDSVGGAPWMAFNRSAETVTMFAAKPRDLAPLGHIITRSPRSEQARGRPANEQYICIIQPVDSLRKKATTFKAVAPPTRGPTGAPRALPRGPY
jgi:hypothetical protein